MTDHALTMEERHVRKIRRIILLIILLAGIFLVGCCLGPYAIAPKDVLAALFGGGTAQEHMAIFDYRLPRLCLAILVGHPRCGGRVIALCDGLCFPDCCPG